MRILVTGGNGYVGRELCRLLSCTHELCIIDNRRYGACRLTSQELAKVQWREVDIRDRTAVESVIGEFQPNVIIHLAAIHFIPECEQQPDLAVTTNVVGTANIASLCPPDARLVFASSGAVYAPEDRPHDELSSLIAPSDVYGLTKLQGEQFVRYFASKLGYSACIVRLFNVIGPGETNPHVLPEIVAQLKANRMSLKLGNLEPKRDYVHVSDVASGFAAVALRGDVPAGETITVNLGTQNAYSVNELLTELKEISGIQFQVENDPTRFRLSDRPYLAANTRRINELFDWKASYTITCALQDLWQNPDLPESMVARYR